MIFPELPYGFKSYLTIKFGTQYYAFVKDGNYDLKFIWDGFSDSFNDVEVRLSYSNLVGNDNDSKSL